MKLVICTTVKAVKTLANKFYSNFVIPTLRSTPVLKSLRRFGNIFALIYELFIVLHNAVIITFGHNI